MEASLILTRILCIGLGILCNQTNQTNVIESENVISDEVVRQQILTRTGPKASSKGHEGVRSSSNTTVSLSVRIDTSKAIHIVDRRYLSTGMGTKEITNDTQLFNTTSPLQQTLLRGLSPAVFRVGGRHGDETVFIVNGSDNAIQGPRWSHINNILTGEQWKSLNEFTIKCGVDLAFTLNVVLRKGLDWDPTNAKELLDFNADLGYRVIWELGNEPLNFKENYGISISAEQLAKDFTRLRDILSEDRYRFSNELVGPDLNHLRIHGHKRNLIKALKSNSSSYLHRFLHHAGDMINATTVHFYNLRAGDNTTCLANLTDPDVLIRTRYELEEFRQVVKNTVPVGSRLKWLGETSSVAGGGIGESLNQYPSGFLILHNLGVAAEMGVSIFIYWNFIGGSYSLLRHKADKIYPSSLYWTLFMHKRLLGTHVLSVTIIDEREEDMAAEKKKSYVHVFAHCTLISPLYPEGSVTVMALNLHNDTKISLNLTGDLANKNIDEYLLEPEGGVFNSKNITLNGKVLEMKNDTHFPDIIPRPLLVGSPIILSPLTYGFYVIKDADAAVCRANKQRTTPPLNLKSYSME